MPAEDIVPRSSPAEHDAHPDARPRFWALNMIGVGVLLALCYYAELVLVVVLVSVLLAFILAPMVDLLMRSRLPRSLAAGITMLLVFAVLVGIVYASYSQAITLVDDLPKYTAKIRNELLRYRQKAESLEVLNPEHERGVVNVRPATDWAGLLTRGFGSFSQAVFAASFIPFLVFFMLTWQSHVRATTVMLFRLENRNTAYVALGMISSMIRSFMAGNVLIGLAMGAVSTLVFWWLQVPFFYFVGFLSAFLSLVPYLGILLALAPPVFMGIGHLDSQAFIAIVITVVALHVLALNVLYPKFLGPRLRLNPLAVTIALLFWAWLWGGIGLVLAIPITAAMKIVFDHIHSLKPYGAWLGE
jgi:predicted PurR-regulated permease PerM